MCTWANVLGLPQLSMQLFLLLFLQGVAGGGGRVLFRPSLAQDTKHTKCYARQKVEEAQAEGEEDEAAAKKRNQINKHSCRRMLHATRQQLRQQAASTRQ